MLCDTPVVLVELLQCHRGATVVRPLVRGMPPSKFVTIFTKYVVDHIEKVACDVGNQAVAIGTPANLYHHTKEVAVKTARGYQLFWAAISKVAGKVNH